jgi:biopolymer transport protein ExbB
MGFFDSLTSWFAKGGVVMWPILLFSVYGTALCWERWLNYRRQERALASSIKVGDDPSATEDELDKAAADDSAACRISRAVRGCAKLADDARMEKVRHAYMGECALLEKHLGIVSVVATLLPMLGLLGTVVGMIASFNAIAVHGTGNPRIVADGISEALITTEAGLITSIPLFYFHQVLSSRSDALARKLDEYTTHLVHAITGEKQA